jgi:hypothetical protein
MGTNGGGIVWTQAAGAALELVTVVNALTTPPLEAPQANGPWRPPQWQYQALTSITDSNGNIYVFDAVIQVEHQRMARKSEHPVQTGANLSDHIFILPARVVLEIGMSDAMDSFASGMWTSASTKSVSAYQKLISLWMNRQPMTLTTRLDTYPQMFITSISIPDNVKTRFGLKATVTFEQMFTGAVTNTSNDSARPQTTESSAQWDKGTTSVPSAVEAQHEYTPQGPITLNGGIGGGSSTQVFTGTNTGYVPGAGNWDSNKVNQGIP